MTVQVMLFTVRFRSDSFNVCAELAVPLIEPNHYRQRQSP